MNSSNKCGRKTSTLMVLLFIFVCSYVELAVADSLHSLLEYFNMAMNCLAIVNSTHGWNALLEGLENDKPIDRRLRCYAYCFLRTAGIVEDALAFKWNDKELTQFVAVIIKDRSKRGNYIMTCYFRCKHITKAVLGTSRCDNALILLMCLQVLGVSFLLVDKTANAEQSRYMARLAGEEETVRRILELKELESLYDRTTVRMIPDVTVLQGFRAEAFWNAFEGGQKRVGMLEDDCCQPPTTNKISGGGQKVEISTSHPRQVLTSSGNRKISGKVTPPTKTSTSRQHQILPPTGNGKINRKVSPLNKTSTSYPHQVLLPTGNGKINRKVSPPTKTSTSRQHQILPPTGRGKINREVSPPNKTSTSHPHQVLLPTGNGKINRKVSPPTKTSTSRQHQILPPTGRGKINKEVSPPNKTSTSLPHQFLLPTGNGKISRKDSPLNKTSASRQHQVLSRTGRGKINREVSPPNKTSISLPHQDFLPSGNGKISRKDSPPNNTSTLRPHQVLSQTGNGRIRRKGRSSITDSTQVCDLVPASSESSSSDNIGVNNYTEPSGDEVPVLQPFLLWTTSPLNPSCSRVVPIHFRP